MSKQNMAATAHGDVEYETVECSSCGTEVIKSDARRFVIGKLKTTEHWGFKHTKEFHFNDHSYAVGWACPYCVDEQVVGFPSPSKIKRYWRKLPEPVRFTVVLFGSILTVFTVMGLVQAVVA